MTPIGKAVRIVVALGFGGWFAMACGAEKDAPPPDDTGVVKQAAVCTASTTPGAPTCVELSATATTTLYESSDASDGAGQKIFTGRVPPAPCKAYQCVTGTSACGQCAPTSDRRALVRFDVSTIPAGSNVTNAALRLTQVSNGMVPGTSTLNAQALSAAFVAGDADSSARDRLATSTVASTTVWSNAPTVTGSASTTTGAAASGTVYEFLDGAILTAVQSWVTSPTTSYGFRIVNTETDAAKITIRGFGGMAFPTATAKPKLQVWYDPPNPTGGTCSTNGECTSGACVSGVCCQTACGGGADQCHDAATKCTGPNSTCESPPVTPGRACGGAAGGCKRAGACDASGVCVQAPDIGAPCGGAPTGECGGQSTCDANAQCAAQLKPDGSPCGESTPDEIKTCQAGQCVVSATRLPNVFTWGSDVSGQLGDRRSGAGLFSTGVVAVTPQKGVIDADAGGDFTVVLQANGTVHTWGRNAEGELGDAAFTGSLRSYGDNVPVASSRTVAVAAGDAHVLLLREDGTVMVWGRNTHGQLGDPSKPKTFVRGPFLVPNLTGVIAIAAGGDSSAALLASGTVKTWGNNADGQLGVGDRADRDAPTSLSFSYRSRAIAVGKRHMLVLSETGLVWAFGANDRQQIGRDMTLNPVTIPYKVFFPTGTPLARHIAAGGNHSLVIDGVGHVWAWGDNSMKQVDSADAAAVVATPRFIDLHYPISDVAGGADFTAALSTQGIVTWGNASAGQLGRGTQCTTGHCSPWVNNIRKIRAGGAHAVAIGPRGTVQSWGANDCGKLGNGGTTDSSVPILAASDPDAPMMSVAAGNYHAVGVAANGYAYGWGCNYYGQAGYWDTSTSVKTPRLVTTSVVAVASGADHALALLADGTVKAWGDGQYGQLGDGRGVSSAWPVTVSGLQNVIAITSRGWHSLALTASGEVWAWGSNSRYQTGVTGGNQLVPVRVSLVGAGVARAIAAGQYASYALETTGNVQAWGMDATGGLGDGTAGSWRAGPARATVLTSVSRISGGYDTGFALLGGAADAWGSNSNYQWGQTTPTSSATPALIAFGARVKAVTGGWATAARIDSTGYVYTAGFNGRGALGNGSTANYSTSPVNVQLTDRASVVDMGSSFGVAVVP